MLYILKLITAIIHNVHKKGGGLVVSQTGEKIADGKTKIIWSIPGTNEVLIESKDDITAGDGVKHDILKNKGAVSTETTSNCFRLLHAAGVKTHFIEQMDERTFRARRVQMIPIELVARRIATGSLLKREPSVEEGTIFETLVLEFFYKDDALHDPLMVWNTKKGCFQLHDAKRPVEEGYLSDLPQDVIMTPSGPINAQLRQRLQRIAHEVFVILEKTWAQQDVALVDLKIECGFDVETQELLVADVIDNDSWRIWPGGDKTKMKDKQVYRNLRQSTPEALGAIKKNYAWVAEKTRQFIL